MRAGGPASAAASKTGQAVPSTTERCAAVREHTNAATISTAAAAANTAAGTQLPSLAHRSRHTITAATAKAVAVSAAPTATASRADTTGKCSCAKRASAVEDVFDVGSVALRGPCRNQRQQLAVGDALGGQRQVGGQRGHTRHPGELV